MKLWIIYSKAVLNPSKNNALSWMLDEAEALGFDANILFTEDLLLETNGSMHKIYHHGTELEYPDAALIRCYDIPMIKHLELAGVQTFNSSYALNQCLDKWTTHQLLAKADIPSPRSIYSEHDVEYEVIKKQLSLPFIVKDIKGARGEQVYLITDELTFSEALIKCDLPLFQEYIDTSFGRDVRLHVIDNQVVASVLRHSEVDFKSNFSQGGNALPYEPDEAMKELAIKSTQALNLNFSGIDILFTEHGYTVCEVNGIPGFRTVGLTSKYNIPNAMMAYIRRQLK